MLVERLQEVVLKGWKDVFSRRESLHRALEHVLVKPLMVGRHTISNTICALGRQQRDWSGDYKLFSRSPWNSEDLFFPVIQHYLERYQEGPIGLALDDTGLGKTGKKIPNARWQRDPLSPPFHVNLRFGLRYLQASLVFPHYREKDCSARALPVSFQEAPWVQKPGKRATAEQKIAYREEIKKKNLSLMALEQIQKMRTAFDQMGAANRNLVFGMDGSYCNKTVFSVKLNRVTILARARKDARLCRPATVGSRRVYDPQRFTPEQVRYDDQVPYQTTTVFYGGKRRQVRFKELQNVLWKRGSGR
jgi:hypothetical protein